MPSADLSQRLLDLTAEQLSVSPAQLQPDALLGDELGVDSLAAIEWGMRIEDTFGISLPEDSWHYIRTYGMVDELVTRLVRRSAAAQA